MNQIPIYQHPFVDVFKATKLTEWGQYSQKEGDVTEVYDKQLAKNVIKVSGVTPASNYFQLPAQAHLPKKPLGLIGKYVSEDMILKLLDLCCDLSPCRKDVRSSL